MTAGSRPTYPGHGRFASLGAAAALAVLAALVSSAATAATAPAPKLDWRPCADPDQKGFQCANPRVPRDYDHPHRSKIHLGVIRHRATDPEHRVGALFVNFGGPGVSKKVFPSYYANYLPAELRARFDIVTWDPRGIGDSTAVQCFDSQEDENRFLAGVGLAGDTFPVGKAEKTRWIRRYRAYGRRCEQTNGGLLRHVSTTDSARDMNLLRRAVGERRLTYWGLSWGTILGANYANLFPKRVRALVLDGDVNPRAYVHRGAKLAGGSFLDTFLRQRSDRGSARTLDAFLELCGRADAGHCAFSAGTPAATKAKFDALLRRLRTHPESADIPYAELVAKTGFLGLYFTRNWSLTASCLQDVWTTGRACSAWAPAPAPAPAPALPPLGAGAAAPTGKKYDGQEQLLAIVCADSPNPRPGAFRALDRFAYERSGAVGPWWSWYAEPCASWPAKAADRYAGPWDRRTHNPVLVMGNTHDPATPYVGAKAMTRQLARARLLTVDGYGHSEMPNPSTCATNHVERYLIDKVLPPKGTRCEQDLQPFGKPVSP
jgi:pimeloyl-ACP methyl ester carboxylesterase